MLTILILTLVAPFGNPANNAAPLTSDDQIICRRETPTGSLITTRQLCMSKAEWNALEQDYKAGGRRMIADRLGRPAGR